MHDAQVSGPAERLELRWVPVTDARGVTHMEARWIVVGPPVAAHPRHAA